MLETEICSLKRKLDESKSTIDDQAVIISSLRADLEKERAKATNLYDKVKLLDIAKSIFNNLGSKEDLLHLSIGENSESEQRMVNFSLTIFLFNILVLQYVYITCLGYN